MKKTIILLTVLFMSNLIFAWEPPVGIPDPRNNEYFGGFDPIEGSHYMYEGQTYDYGNGPEPYNDAGNGPYTHYIDNTHSNATDSDNPFETGYSPPPAACNFIAEGLPPSVPLPCISR